jgi:tetrahydromethanopterin:alpha-L-glutamate ligase
MAITLQKIPTKARRMLVIRDGKDAPSEVERFKQDNPVMYIQQKLDIQGRDLGIVFLGGHLCQMQ